MSQVIILKGMAEEETSVGSKKNRLEVLFDANGLPVGNNSHKLSTKVGKLVQTHLPIGFKTWKKVPTAEKNGIWEKLKMDFILPKSYKDICIKSMAARWRKRKSNLRKVYIDPCRSNKERLRNIPPQVQKEDWKKFVELSTSKQMMELRRRNANSRKHLNMYHRTGRDGLARLAEKMRVEGDDVNRTIVYLKSRAKKGESDSYSEDVLPRANRLMDLLKTQSQEENTDLETDPLTQVFGPDNKGRMRGVSIHVPRSRYLGSIPTNEKLVEVEDHNGGLKGELGQLKVDMQEVKECMGSMTEVMKSWKSLLMDHIVADSLLQMHDSTSEKPPPSKGQPSNTDTVQEKSANRKSTTLARINGTIEQNCEVADSLLQMHGSTLKKSSPSKGQPSNTHTVQEKSANRKSARGKSATLARINGTTEQKCEVADNLLQMHGSTLKKSPPSKGQPSNTDTVHHEKSAKRKSTTPARINGTAEQKCEVLDWRRNLVATGRVHTNPNQKACHGISFSKEEVVVIVDIIHNGKAELYAPSSFAAILSDVGIGGYIKWHVSGIRYV